MSIPLLHMTGVSKSYPGVRALDNVDIRLEKGQVHALIGKNGAGKSTLIKVLGGAVRPDEGEIRIDGESVSLQSPTEAIRLGIAIVHQELAMVPELSVADNLALGAWPMRGLGQVDRRALQMAACEALNRVGCDVDPRARIGSLSVARQQMVEIARAMMRAPRILVLDEPTSSLADDEAQRLIDLVRRLAAEGVGVIYISHRLAEIEALADVVTVLRDGHSVASHPLVEMDRGRIVELMVGEGLSEPDAHERRESARTAAAPLLKVRGLTRPGVLEDISFDLWPGEILGLAGLVGAGRTELARALFGRDPIASGTIEVRGRGIGRPTPRKMRRAGVGLIPEDRKGQGLVMMRSIAENATLASLRNLSFCWMVKFGAERAAVAAQIDALHIKAASSGVRVSTLSGGNQQKVVIAKWMMRDPAVLILDEPTRGVDVQAKAQIFAILRALSERGTGIILISSELEEVLDMSDRILTIARGRIVAETRASDATLASLLHGAAGH